MNYEIGMTSYIPRTKKPSKRKALKLFEKTLRNCLIMFKEIVITYHFIAVGFNQRHDDLYTKGFSQKSLC